MTNHFDENGRIKYVAPTESQLADAVHVVNLFAEKWANPDAEGLRDLMHADTKNLIPPMTAPADREGVIDHFRQVLQQLPDLTIEVVRWAPTGDTVMIEWRAQATVAGKRLSWTGVDRFGIRGDRMYEAQVYWDTRRVAEQFAEAVQSKQDPGQAAH